MGHFHLRAHLMRLVDCNGTRHRGKHLTYDGRRGDLHDCTRSGCYARCRKCGGAGIIWVVKMPRRFRRKTLT